MKKIEIHDIKREAKRIGEWLIVEIRAKRIELEVRQKRNLFVRRLKLLGEYKGI